MKTLIPTDSPLYLKRLVRELNNQPNSNGFWMKSPGVAVRSNRARMRKGAIEVRSPIYGPHGGACGFHWIRAAADATFEDQGPRHEN